MWDSEKDAVGNHCLILQITFNPQGTTVLTASSDKTARLWDPETGSCKQILEGHTDEIFSCAFNYEGNTIITGKISLDVTDYCLFLCKSAVAYVVKKRIKS